MRHMLCRRAVTDKVEQNEVEVTAVLISLTKTVPKNISQQAFFRDEDETRR